jgi:hemoglobin
MTTKIADSTLYQRVGGYDVIAAFVDELFHMLKGDARFSRFGVGRSIDSHQRARQLLVDQICNLAGRPCLYIGRDMKTSHVGLGITEDEWEINLDYTRHALRKLSVGKREINEVVALFQGYKAEIVETANQAPTDLQLGWWKCKTRVNLRNHQQGGRASASE